MAPTLGITGHSAEVLLEGETDLTEITAGSHDLRHGLCHCIDSSVIRAPGGQVRIEAVAHHGHGIGLAFQYGQLGYHGLGLGQLIFSAVRHQYAAGTDGGVKHLHQTLLGTYIEVV